MYYINGIGDACEGHDQGIGTHLASGDPKEYSRTVGDKRYELSNHLGNVLSVITDRKLIGGNVVGETLVYNFTFEATKDGFEPTSTGSFIPDNSRLAMSANGNNGGAQKLISLVPNKTYMVSFDLERGNYLPSVTADMTYTLNGTGYISGSLTTSASGHQSFMVVLPADAPAAQQLRFRLRQGNYNLWPHVFYVDNVTVTELSNNFTAGLQPDVVEYYDYDPFGMQIAKRSTQLGKYRYGFNGKEKDDELKGEGNSLDFGARMYDSRLGRWFAPDPLEEKQPSYSTYNYAINNPIFIIDSDGRLPSPWRIFSDLFREFTNTTAQYFHITAQNNGLNKLNPTYSTRIGRVFEDAVIRSLGEIKNTQKFRPSRTSTKTVIPDLVGSGSKHYFDLARKKDIVASFPNASFTDAKFTNSVTFAPSYNPDQLKGFIDVLSNMKGGYINGEWNPEIKASDYGAASLIFITPKGASIDPEIITYAATKNVNVYQRTVEQDVENPSNIRVAPNMIPLNISIDKHGEENIPPILKGPGQSVNVNWSKL